MKLSSRLLCGASQQRQSVLFASRHYFHQRNSRDKSKSLKDIDKEKRGEQLAACCLVIIIYLPLLYYCLASDLWLPLTAPPKNTPSNMEEEVRERIYAERCALYSSGHAFHSFIIDQCFIAFAIMVLFYSLCLPAILRFRGRFRVIDQFELVLILLLCLAGSCVCIQIASVLTCRPFEILFDLRFISMLTAQLLGFIGCLLFAYKLGSTFPIKIPKNISPRKIPFSQSSVINLK